MTDVVTLNAGGNVYATLCNGFAINSFYEGAPSSDKTCSLTKWDAADTSDEAAAVEVFTGGSCTPDYTVNALGNMLVYTAAEDATAAVF